MKIVVVEDEIRIREGICNLIQKMFQEHEIVGEAENGEEGLNLILATKPDLVIMDIMMPVMDGLEMLTKLYQQKMKTKFIALSAYSEFAYAQKAMKLGVSEYLLKPIMVGDFTQAIKTIENQCAEEKKVNPQVLGSKENILFGMIYGGLKIDEELCQFIENNYAFDRNMSFSEMQVYFGNEYQNKHEQIERELEHLLKEKKDVRYCFLNVPKDQMFLVFLYTSQDLHAIERWIQNYLLYQRKTDSRYKNISVGWIDINGIADIKKANQKLSKYLDWNIALGESIIISYPQVLKIQTVPCVYPIDLENRMKADMCAYNRSGVQKSILQFQKHFAGGQVYSPKEIKESYVRFLWGLINVSKEIGALNIEKFEQQVILEMIMSAKNTEELRIVCTKVFDSIITKEEKGTSAATLTVKRAESIVNEFYNTGITLDEIALKLNITPEYLGTQFHKEMGKNFSTYIKEIRMKKAKELLIGSQLKIYEIAQKVGYADAKYFSRVFKECTELLPAEYRKMNK